MDAFFLVDKPQGISSFGVISQMRKILQERKMGHTGTLDPLATGCLLIATGKYTKLIPFFDADTKEYECSILLDGQTDSYDIEEPVRYISSDLQQEFKDTLTKKSIEQVLHKNFTGEINQIPPKYSALKIGGKKAVDIVRKGGDVEMKTRKVTIHKIEVLDFSYPRLQLRILVSAGTYIRSIAHDLGEILGTGGYIETLRRTKIGQLDIKNSTHLEHLSEQNSINIIDLFGEKKCFSGLEEEVVLKIGNGQKVRGDFPFPQGEDIFILDKNMVQFIVRYEGGILFSRRRIC